MIFIDTGALVGKHLVGDPYADLAREQWLRLSRTNEPLMTSNLVIVEFATFLVRRAGGRFAAKRVMQLYEQTDIEIARTSPQDERLAVGLLEKYSDQKLGFVDATSIVLMRRHGVRRVFSFDRHFDMAGFDRFPLIGP